MSEYRRWYIPGGSYFFTVVTYRRQPLLADPESVNQLRGALRRVRSEWPFEIVGAVVLPDHIHFIWTLPPGDADYSRRIGRMKALFSSNRADQCGNNPVVSASRRKHREREVWQRRFWEHMLRDEDDLKRHLDYIHYNCVKHGLAACPHAWPYSSFDRHVRERVYSSDWQCTCDGRTPKPLSFGSITSKTIAS